MNSMNSMKRKGKMRDWAKDQRELDEVLGFNVFCFQCRYNYFDWEVKPKTVRLKCQHCNLVISIKKDSLEEKTQRSIC